LLKHCKEVSSDDKISASKRKLCEEAISNIILQYKKNKKKYTVKINSINITIGKKFK